MDKPTLRDSVMARIPRKGTPPWYTSLDDGLRAELEAMKSDFHAGVLGARVTRTGLAFAISASLQEQGIDIGHKGVEAWLKKAD